MEEVLRRLKISTAKLSCEFCGKKLDEGHRSYMANTFCNDRDCYERRLEATGAIDLRDNHKVIDLGNGYVQVKPIDPMRKFIAGT